MNLHELDLFAVVVLVYLGLVVPLIGLWENRRLVSWTAAGRADARLATYRWIMVFEWVSVLVLLAWWLLLGRSTVPLMLSFDFAGWRWLPVGLAVALSVVQVWQTRVALGKPDELAKVRDKLGDLQTLAPRGARELKTFNALAVTAGVCEEILYRSVLLAVVAAVVGYWPALAVTSLIFGLGHIYQGPAGVVKTGAVGAVFGLLTILSGSVIPAMVLHAVIDLTAGQTMAAAMDLPDTADAMD